MATRQPSAADMVPFNNYSATTLPGASNDSSQGYGVGSQWIDTTTGRLFRCLSAVSSAAVWVAAEFLGSAPYQAGWHLPYREVVTAGSAPGSTTLRIHPIVIRSRCTIDQLACRISTASAGGHIQLALYNKRSNTDLLPGLLIDKTGSIVTDSSASLGSSLAASQQVWPGLYWAAVQHDNATSACSHPGINPAGELIGSTTLTDVISGNSAGLCGFALTNTFASWPSDLSAKVQGTDLLASNFGSHAAIALHVTSAP